MFPPFICALGSPNIGVFGDRFGIEGVDDVNENIALGIGLNGDVAGPVFGKPTEGGADVVNLLPNTGFAKNAELELKAEDGTVTVADVVAEPAAQENRELEFKGLKPIVTEPTGESTKRSELPKFEFSEDLKHKLFAELSVNMELIFSD